ncbi:MAG: glycosyltransferase family 4 protein [Flavitalea sp.]
MNSKQRIFIDITSCIKYRNLRPNGIVRTEIECIKYTRAKLGERVSYCAISKENGKLVLFDDIFVDDLVNNFDDFEKAKRTKNLIGPNQSSGSTYPNENSIKKKFRLRSVIRNAGIGIYRKLPPEIAAHFKMAVLETIETVRVTFRHFSANLKKLGRKSQKSNAISSEMDPKTKYEMFNILDQGDIFITLGFTWDYINFDQLFVEKKQKGFKLVTLVYDLIPILMPEFQNGNLEIYSGAILNQLWTSDLIFCISDNTMNDLHQLTSQVEAPSPVIKRIRLGDFKSKHEQSFTSSKFNTLEKGKFILYTATMEPRKNHILLFHIWRTLFKEMGDQLLPLIWVGNQGWLTEELRYMIHLNPWLYPKYIKWFTDVTDEELDWLMNNCRFTVFPSIYEGWGLPINEAIEHGKFCISSNTSSMPEAGRGLTELIHPLDFYTWKEKIRYYMINDEELRNKEEKIRNHDGNNDWEHTYNDFFKQIELFLSENRL